jgi:hypothetical protein
MAGGSSEVPTTVDFLTDPAEDRATCLRLAPETLFLGVSEGGDAVARRNQPLETRRASCRNRQKNDSFKKFEDVQEARGAIAT